MKKFLKVLYFAILLLFGIAPAETIEKGYIKLGQGRDTNV